MVYIIPNHLFTQVIPFISTLSHNASLRDEVGQNAGIQLLVNPLPEVNRKFQKNHLYIVRWRREPTHKKKKGASKNNDMGVEVFEKIKSNDISSAKEKVINTDWETNEKKKKKCY